MAVGGNSQQRDQTNDRASILYLILRINHKKLRVFGKAGRKCHLTETQPAVLSRPLSFHPLPKRGRVLARAGLPARQNFKHEKLSFINYEPLF